MSTKKKEAKGGLEKLFLLGKKLSEAAKKVATANDIAELSQALSELKEAQEEYEKEVSS